MQFPIFKHSCNTGVEHRLGILAPMKHGVFCLKYGRSASTAISRQYTKSILSVCLLCYRIDLLRIRLALIPVASPEYFSSSGRYSRILPLRRILARRNFSLCLALGLLNFFFPLFIYPTFFLICNKNCNIKFLNSYPIKDVSNKAIFPLV